MSDIVERLRDQGKDAFAKQYSLGMFKLCDEAAGEIEFLRERLRGSLDANSKLTAEKLQHISLVEQARSHIEKVVKAHGFLNGCDCYDCKRMQESRDFAATLTSTDGSGAQDGN